ncbi:lysozyme inhibitor LprI family protein [Thetidibacter halocola]|uniref:DUF1311 domain-containing protein n=1 Tax=Thetidibacter halocola TaxID=2827239 RepID=A0A8J7WFM4_9RHOB|nr:lysozyme inhibitor LprI family protein [Thetidibacter halocola]MBS0124269.1 DUF1311 domain-containing protein [Thetidibacter halocola]
MRPFVLALFLLVPGAAQAQQAQPADVQTLQSCVQNYANGAPQSRVIGGCVGIIDGAFRNGTTLEIAEGIMREHAAWDTLLNAWWQPMKARAQANGTWDRLLASQRQWIRDRDAECQRAYDSAGGGSIRVIYAAECQRDLTAAKAVDFFYSLYK